MLLLQYFITYTIIISVLLDISVSGRIFKRSTIEKIFSSDDAKHYLSPAGLTENHDVVKFFKKRHSDVGDLEFYFKILGMDSSIKLEKDILQEYLINDNMPIWLRMKKNGKSTYEKVEDFFVKNVMKIYSSENDTCFVMSDVLRMRTARSIQINGIIGNFVIRSLDSRITRRIKRVKRNIDEHTYYGDYLNGTFEATDYHLIYYDENLKESTFPPNEIREDYSKVLNRVKRQYFGPHVLYPRILLTTNFNDTIKSRNDPALYPFINYLISFWAAVDLKFRPLYEPFIRLHISGIIIETEIEEISYIIQNLNHTKLDIVKGFNDMIAFYNDESNEELSQILTETSSNIVVAMTSLELCHFVSSDCESMNGMGYAFERCNRASNSEYFHINAFALIRAEPSNYNGIYTAAHEIGHILGSQHDGEGSSSDCLPSQNKLMSPESDPEFIPWSKNHWSICSRNAIEETALNRSTSICMNFVLKPNGNRLCIRLPGEQRTRHHQCNDKGEDFSCEDYSCILKCRCYNFLLSCSDECTAWGYVLDGTSCNGSSEHHCINGQCILKPKNLN